MIALNIDQPVGAALSIVTALIIVVLPVTFLCALAMCNAAGRTRPKPPMNRVQRNRGQR